MGNNWLSLTDDIEVEIYWIYIGACDYQSGAWPWQGVANRRSNAAKHGGSDDREMNVVWGVEYKTGFVEDNTNRS